MKWYFRVLGNYAVFNGRARRKEYWMFRLFHTIIYLLLIYFLIASGFEQYIIFIIYFIITLIPSFALTVRRLHDIGNSGWMVFINLIPLIGGIILFIFALQDSQPGENKYGKNPKTNG